MSDKIVASTAPRFVERRALGLRTIDPFGVIKPMGAGAAMALLVGGIALAVDEAWVAVIAGGIAVLMGGVVGILYQVKKYFTRKWWIEISTTEGHKVVAIRSRVLAEGKEFQLEGALIERLVRGIDQVALEVEQLAKEAWQLTNEQGWGSNHDNDREERVLANKARIKERLDLTENVLFEVRQLGWNERDARLKGGVVPLAGDQGGGSLGEELKVLQTRNAAWKELTA